MSANLTNDSSPSLHPPQCHQTEVGLSMYSAVIFTYVLSVLPPSVFVLAVGIQRWRRQRSGASAATSTHSDFFTYNMAVVELVAIFGYVFFFCGFFSDHPVISFVGPTFGLFSWVGQLLFPLVTCVERYLAVVHPITYLGLRQGGGVRIRNITTACVWLTCLVGAGLSIVLYIFQMNFLPFLFPLVLSLLLITFLSVSVLRVLIRPPPGKEGGVRAQADQSKQRAFKTILAITAVLWFKFGGSVVSLIMRYSTVLSVQCFGDVSPLIFSLPCSLVLPLLFLHRAGKLPLCSEPE